MRIQTTIVALALLGGCGGGADSGGSGTMAAAGGGWDALDACTTTGSATVAAATGSEVIGTELDPKVEPAGGGAGFSMCTFKLAGGASMTVLTREAPDDSAIDQGIAEARRLGAEFGSAAEDVPGIGRAAMWTAKPPALQVFIDGRRYATISMFTAKSTPDASDGARAAATEVARKLAS